MSAVAASIGCERRFAGTTISMTSWIARRSPTRGALPVQYAKRRDDTDGVMLEINAQPDRLDLSDLEEFAS